MHEQTKSHLQHELRLTWSRMRLQSPHERLGLRPGADEEAVYDAFRDLASRYHPDAFAHATSPEVTATAVEVFVLLAKARDEVLRLEAQRLQQLQRPVPKAGLQALHQASRMYESLEDTTHASSEDLERDLHGPRKQALRELHERTAQRTRGRTTSSALVYEVHSTWDGAALKDTLEQRHAKLIKLEQRARPKPPKEFSETLSASSSMSFSDPRSTLPTRGLAPDLSYAASPLDALDAQQSFNLGWRAFKSGQVAEALEPLRKAHEDDPENALFATYYAYALFLKDPVEKSRAAEKMLQRALDSDDEQARPDTHLFLGRVLQKRGEKCYRRAMYHFREAMILNPHSEEAKRDFEELKRKHVDANRPSTMRVIRRVFQR
ncbi:MAG: hypothetical protein AAGI01_00210 [Myxococcota bacterium]